LLRLYPRRWRERFGDEFDALLADSRSGPRLLLDVARAALDERIREGDIGMKRLLPWALAGFGFGYYRPRRAWLFAGLLWLAIPLSGIYADALNYHPGQVKPAPIYTTLIALIPVLLGAYVGAGARWLLPPLRRERE
jgi:hypothetical protein